MNKIGWTKTIRTKAGFTDVGLTEEEERELMAAVRELHIEQMQECLEEARKLLGPLGHAGNVVNAAVALFDKRATGIYGFYEDALKAKVSRIKDAEREHT